MESLLASIRLGSASDNLAFACKGFISAVCIGEISNTIHTSFGIIAQVVLDVFVQSPKAAACKRCGDKNYSNVHLRISVNDARM